MLNTNRGNSPEQEGPELFTLEHAADPALEPDQGVVHVLEQALVDYLGLHVDGVVLVDPGIIPVVDLANKHVAAIPFVRVLLHVQVQVRLHEFREEVASRLCVRSQAPQLVLVHDTHAIIAEAAHKWAQEHSHGLPRWPLVRHDTREVRELARHALEMIMGYASLIAGSIQSPVISLQFEGSGSSAHI